MKRDKIARIAKLEAQKCFHGNVMGLESNIEPIINLFPKWSLENWDGKWCAAFVYYCCIKAGFNIPVRFPNENVKCNFAGCSAWESWASLPENQFYYMVDNNFFPGKGDIVIYNNVFVNEPHDHIGIVLEDFDDYIIAAEGNIGNVSGIVIRKKNKNIRGYIRIPNDYTFIR
ncbi:CHAP domain-containing protein [Tissierella sp.]|uniref:CHAP domain-containing protein n=1 Tax=Tissierella sp. TaxID=41274 RepID=UPI00285AC4A3|nr:CHAP domain-containing protein [Tissierella sp.]MDR7857841.1 CHAP domain-containing protein [Tissierella sp.]